VLFQGALGALHIDILMGGKLRADPIIRSGQGLDVHYAELQNFVPDPCRLRRLELSLKPLPRSTAAVDVRLLSPLFEDFALRAEPILFGLAGFTTSAFIQFIGPLSYPVL